MASFHPFPLFSVVFSIIALLSSGAVGGAPATRMALGGNLDGLDDWTTSWVFKDCFKLSREWLTRRVTGSEWESNQTPPLDADGWPRGIPFAANGTQHYVHTLLPLYGPGSYTVRFQGSGHIELIAPNGGGRHVITSAGGRMSRTFRFNPTLADNMLLLELRASLAADPVRNIEVIAPGQDVDLQAKPLHPLFVASLAPYKTLRFMDWMKTNLTPLKTWSERTKLSSYTQTRIRGAAHEYLVALANETRKNAWICIPHAADDDYVRRTARLYRDTLDPQLQLYVEYSNETWNGVFAAAGYVQEQGSRLGLDANPWMAGQKFVAKRSAEIFRIFTREFGPAQRGRLVNVLATQAANLGVTTQRLDAMDDPRINPSRVKPDAIAIAPYFGVNYEPGDPVPTAGQVATTLSQTTIREALGWTRAQREVAKSRGLHLLCYEGGQHFVGIFGAENNSVLTGALHAGNRDPRMQDRYREYLAGLQREGVDLFVNFSHVGSWTQWGSWAALEHQRQPAAQAPKWRALVDWSAESAALADRKVPSLRVTAPSASYVSTRAPRFLLKGDASDDVAPTHLQFRVRPPGSGFYGSWSTSKLGEERAKTKTWSRSVALDRVGDWSVQVRVLDAAGNGGDGRILTIRRW